MKFYSKLYQVAAVCSFLVVPLSSYAQQPVIDEDGYQLVWSDEFNGNALDEDAWNIEVNGDGGGNAELQYYCRENVAVQDGCLVLTAKRESKNGKSFTSGRLNSYDKVFFTRGRIESRIKFPATQNGLWPAFWLLGNDYTTNGWPSCGEIDIVEMGNSEGIRRGTQDRFFNGACHWGFYRDGAYPNYAKSTTNSYSLQDGNFHLFTLEWDEEYVSMYLDRDLYPDAEPYYKMGVSEMTDDWSTGRYFQHDFFIVYDLAVGGYFTNILSPSNITALNDDNDQTASMYVDWVRVYQKSDEVNAFYPVTYDPTGIDLALDQEKKTPVRTDFFNLGGGVSSTPNKGLVIARTWYADGSSTVQKLVR